MYATMKQSPVLVVVFAMILAPGLAFTLLSSADERSHSRPRLLPMVQATKGEIEFQSDESNYGRGEMHLSAVLDIGDVVVYQTGTWLVDGVQVGDGSPPKYEYGLVETIQLVWTHNCEHGVIRALPLALLEDGEAQVLRIEEEECIEFGPEQLVAKLPLQWDEGASEATVESPLELSEELWEPMAS